MTRIAYVPTYVACNTVRTPPHLNTLETKENLALSPPAPPQIQSSTRGRMNVHCCDSSCLTDVSMKAVSSQGKSKQVSSIMHFAHYPSILTGGEGGGVLKLQHSTLDYTRRI
jgi:hypothetical protein